MKRKRYCEVCGGEMEYEATRGMDRKYCGNPLCKSEAFKRNKEKRESVIFPASDNPDILSLIS